MKLRIKIEKLRKEGVKHGGGGIADRRLALGQMRCALALGARAGFGLRSSSRGSIDSQMNSGRGARICLRRIDHGEAA